MMDEKILEKNAILKAIDFLEYHEPKLYCGFQCVESDKEICKKCKKEYVQDHIKWENKKKYWEDKLNKIQGDIEYPV